MIMEGYKYMGCVNSFRLEYKDGNPVRTIYPDAIQKCRDSGHKLEGSSTNRGYHKYWCPICKIWWDMDSGD